MWHEAGRIDAAVAQLASSKLAHSDIELIFVDDGSTDDTSAICRASLERHALVGLVLSLPTNQGKGAAVRHGVLAANGEVIGFSDADLSCGPPDIERVFRVVADGEADVAIASRTESTTVIAERQPWARRWSGFAFNLELRLLGLTSFKDTQCGLKAFRADVAHQLFEPLQVRRFAFDVELLARARRASLSVVQVPVRWEHVEASRVSPLKDGGRMVLDALRIRWVISRRGPR